MYTLLIKQILHEVMCVLFTPLQQLIITRTEGAARDLQARKHRHDMLRQWDKPAD